MNSREAFYTMPIFLKPTTLAAAVAAAFGRRIPVRIVQMRLPREKARAILRQIRDAQR